MTKRIYHRIFIREGDDTYLLGRIWQLSSDESIALQIQPGNHSSGGQTGVIKKKSDNTYEIIYDQLTPTSGVEHTSIHATGQSHSKNVDGTYSYNYTKDNSGIPLHNLTTMKHLGTLVGRAMQPDENKDADRVTDVIIQRGKGQIFTVVDLFAIPKNMNLTFTSYSEGLPDRDVAATIDLKRIGFRDLDIILFTQSSDKFNDLPNMTLHLPDLNHFVPQILSIDSKKTVFQLTDLTFEDTASIENQSDNPDDNVAMSLEIRRSD